MIKYSDKSMYILMTVGIPILISSALAMAYYFIISGNLQALFNAVWAAILIPICFHFRQHAKGEEVVK